MGDSWDDRATARRLLGAMLAAVYIIALLLALFVLIARQAKAEALSAAGKGEERTRFEGSNTTGTNVIAENYEMRPVVYVSFHDPEVYPSLREALPQTKLPVYWGVGSRDAAGGGKKPSYDRLPPNPASVYAEIDGDHNSIMRDALPAMVKWAKGL